MKFQADNHIERAEFIDPIIGSSFVRNELQNQFTEIFPNVRLQPQTLKKTSNVSCSASFTVENLLKASEFLNLPIVPYQDKHCIRNQTTQNQNGIEYSNHLEPNTSDKEELR
ncbi:unnamed protein product, partial [Rotaria sp. Silwood1]